MISKIAHSYVDHIHCLFVIVQEVKPLPQRHTNLPMGPLLITIN